MNEKISWYREVLEIEPDSRLFLPLARLLVEEGLMKEAERVLDQGVARHPSFLEARLFRVEVLRAMGRTEEGMAELGELVPVLSRNTGFWKAWAESEHVLGREGASLAVRLLDLVMSGAVVDMQDIIRRGIESLEMELAAASNARTVTSARQAMSRQAGFGSAEPGTAKQEGMVVAPRAPKAPRTADVMDATNAQITLAHSDASPASAVSTRAATHLSPAAPAAPARPAGPVEAATPAKGALGEKDKSHWPPRTRSMAEVYAEQEQYREAASIYEELIEKCRVGQCDEEPAQLVRRRDELLALACGKRPEDRADHADLADLADLADCDDQVPEAREAGRTPAESAPGESSPAERFPDVAVGMVHEPLGNESPGNESPGNESLDNDVLGNDVLGNDVLGNDVLGNAVVRLSPPTEEDGLVSILEALARRMEARIG